MTSTLSKVTRSPVYRIVVAQVIATIFASASSLVLDRVAVVSALLAGVVCIVPGLYVLGMTIRPVAPGSTGMDLVLRGEIGKLLITAILFVAVFISVKPLNVWVFFTTIVILQLCNAVVPVLEARKMIRKVR